MLISCMKSWITTLDTGGRVTCEAAGNLAGVGIAHLRRPMPMLVVHLRLEPNGGSDTGHSPLPLYQVSRSSRTLDFDPATLLPPRYLESTKAVLHVIYEFHAMQA